MFDLMQLMSFGTSFLRDGVLWIRISEHGKCCTACDGSLPMPTPVLLMFSPTEEEIRASLEHPLVKARIENATPEEKELVAAMQNSPFFRQP